MSEGLQLCAFDSADTIALWTVVTDNVMGGLSEGVFAADSEGTGLFSGSVSLENSGGFASVRSTSDLKECAGYTGLRVSLQGDGKSYQLRAHRKSDERGESFKHDFSTTNGEWMQIDLPFADFVLSAHGQLKPEAGKIDSAEIHQLSFLIAGGQAGEFSLKIRSIEAYR